MCGKKILFTISIKICFFLLFWPAEKGTHFKFQWNFTKKRGKLILKHYFILHLICYIAHQWFIWTTTELMFQDQLLYCTKKVPKNHNDFFSLSSQRWNTLPGACSDLDITRFQDINSTAVFLKWGPFFGRHWPKTKPKLWKWKVSWKKPNI